MAKRSKEPCMCILRSEIDVAIVACAHAAAVHRRPPLARSAMIEATFASFAVMRSLRIICPNGHLGFAPTREESFRLGVAARPDCIAADSAATTSARSRSARTRRRARSPGRRTTSSSCCSRRGELGVPMIIGSSGDTGANSRVDLYVKVIRELAAKHKLSRFKLGYFYSELDREDVRGGCARARRSPGSKATRR